MEMRIATANYASTTISELMKEIEQNENDMEIVRAIASQKEIAAGDMLEAIASHIVITDTDYVAGDEHAE